MATLKQMLAKYGQHGTARIMQYEGYPVTQPRIAEALSPRKGRSEASAEARYYELDRIARKIKISNYPGVPEGEAVVSSRTLAPPVYQTVKQHRATAQDIRRRKVTQIQTGYGPHKARDDTLTWEKPRVIVPELSLEKWLNTAIRRFGENAKVGVQIFGVFAAHFGRYLPSIRFPSFNEDYYVHHTTIGELVRALRRVEADTQLAEKQATGKAEQKIARAGSPGNTEAYPGYTARWASIWAFRYIEVNYLSIWKETKAQYL